MTSGVRAGAGAGDRPGDPGSSPAPARKAKHAVERGRTRVRVYEV